MSNNVSIEIDKFLTHSFYIEKILHTHFRKFQLNKTFNTFFFNNILYVIDVKLKTTRHFQYTIKLLFPIKDFKHNGIVLSVML